MRMEKLKRLVDPARPITYGIVQAGPEFEGGVPYIRPADMTDEAGVKDLSQIKRTSPEIAEQYRRSAVKTGDLIVSIGPSFGKVMVVPRELEGANLTQGTARISAGPRIATRFLFWCLRSEHCFSQWEASIGGATFRALNLGPLAETRIPYHEIDQQNLIAAFLDKEINRIDKIIDTVGGHIAAKNALHGSFLNVLLEKRSALITAAVTGQIDVTTYSKSGTPDRHLDAIQEEMRA